MGMQKKMYKSNPFFLRRPQSMYIYIYIYITHFLENFNFWLKPVKKFILENIFRILRELF